MIAPDKIYINGWSAFSTEPVKDGTEYEYIRKDALLKKLENVAAEYKKRSDKGELVWQNMCGIKQAIDILNKM